MTPIRNIALAAACAGMLVSGPMAAARTTSGGVPVFTASAQAPTITNVPEGTISDDGDYVFREGKWHRLKNGKWILLIGAASILVGGVIILATNSN